MLPRRIRAKASPTTADPTWAASNLDPHQFTVDLGGTTADGVYAIDILPELDPESPISIEHTRSGAEDDGDIADALETEGTTLIGTTLASYLRSIESDGAGLVTVRYLPNAPAFRVETRAPVGATAALNIDDCFPITDQGGGQGKLFLEFVAVDADGEPLAPGSGTLDVAIVHVRDRRYPQGPNKNAYVVDDATASVTSTDETEGQALSLPLVVDAPPGRFTVTITGGASMPVGTDTVEVWASIVRP